MVSDTLYSSDKMDWETPQDFFDTLDQEFGFALDVCATMENTKCRCFFTKDQGGLAHGWGMWPQSVWCNPPYGREIGDWVCKAHHEAQKNGVTVVLLIPARTDTKYWHEWVMRAAEIRFVRGRLRFQGGTSCAPFPSAVIVFRPGHKGPPVISSIGRKANE